MESCTSPGPRRWSGPLAPVSILGGWCWGGQQLLVETSVACLEPACRKDPLLSPSQDSVIGGRRPQGPAVLSAEQLGLALESQRPKHVALDEWCKAQVVLAVLAAAEERRRTQQGNHHDVGRQAEQQQVRLAARARNSWSCRRLIRDIKRCCVSLGEEEIRSRLARAQQGAVDECLRRHWLASMTGCFGPASVKAR